VDLVTAGVEMDVLGLAYLDVPDAQRETIVKAHPGNTSRSRSSVLFTADSGTSKDHLRNR